MPISQMVEKFLHFTFESDYYLKLLIGVSLNRGEHMENDAAPRSKINIKLDKLLEF